MEPAHKGFNERRSRISDYSRKQPDTNYQSPGQSLVPSELHDLLASGQLERRVDELLEELFPYHSRQGRGRPLPKLSGCDQYELLEQIGQGAFSRVFKAIDRRLGNRLVVVKTGRLSESESAIAGRLNHKHIMPVYSSLKDESGMTTICMPYLGRYTLQDKIAHLATRFRFENGTVHSANQRQFDFLVGWRRHLENRSILTHLRQICGALAYAHNQQVLHLDIKPSNILIGFCGNALLLDFNLAGDLVLQKSPAGGTLSYMAPEHLRHCVLGKSVELDRRADIYSLGVLMFELFLGFRPFDSAGPAMHARQQAQFMLERQKHVASLFKRNVPGLSIQLQRIIQRCLQFHAADRYHSIEQLQRALNRLERRFRLGF